MLLFVNMVDLVIKLVVFEVRKSVILVILFGVVICFKVWKFVIVLVVDGLLEKFFVIVVFVFLGNKVLMCIVFVLSFMVKYCIILIRLVLLVV